MPSQYPKQTKDFGSSNVAARFKNYVFNSCIGWKLSAQNTAACIFCNILIPFGQSACSNCMKKYNIQYYDMSNDGCGCDK